MTRSLSFTFQCLLKIIFIERIFFVTIGLMIVTIVNVHSTKFSSDTTKLNEKIVVLFQRFVNLFCLCQVILSSFDRLI